MRQITLLCLAISAPSTLDCPAFHNKPSAQSMNFHIAVLACYYSQSKEIQKSQQSKLRKTLTASTTRVVRFVVRNYFYELSQDMQELLTKIKHAWYLESIFCQGQRDRDKFCTDLKEFITLHRDQFEVVFCCNSQAIPNVLTETNCYLHHRGKRLLIEDSVEILAKHVNWKEIIIPKPG